MPDNRVVILAGGKGTRLRPFTASFPKPLVPLGDMPILEVVLRQLARQGFGDVTLALGHLSELIKAYIAHHADLTQAIRVNYVDETSATGTAGSLANITGLDDTFLVMNGDVLTDLDFAKLIRAHKRSGAALTIAGHSQSEKIDLGILEAGPSGALIDYIEKPVRTFEVSMGVYVYEPRVLKLIEKGAYLDFPDLVRRLLARGEKVQVHRSGAFWLDIGRPDDYAEAQKIFETEPERFGIQEDTPCNGNIRYRNRSSGRKSATPSSAALTRAGSRSGRGRLSSKSGSR